MDETLVNDSDITPMTIVSTMVRPNKTYSLKEGDMLGSYRIRKPLGHGGMGEVYLALHTKLNVLRAIKVLPANSGNKSKKYAERFLQEARLAISLEHPNIITIYDAEYDEEHALYYFVMEYVDGGTVRNTLRTIGPYQEKQALMIALKVSEALSAAARHDLVHRDIKPDNIMMTRKGAVKVADFGIAKTDFGDARPGSESERVSMTGTPAYMSPEQTTNPDKVDARADIYSLGVTMYEMLTATKPYPGEKAVDILDALFHQPVPDVRRKNPDVSKATAELIMRMMAKRRDERPPNAGLVAMEIRQILNGAPKEPEAPKEVKITPRKITCAGRTQSGNWISRFVHNHWFLAGVTAGVTFFVLTAMSYAGYLWYQQRNTVKAIPARPSGPVVQSLEPEQFESVIGNKNKINR